MIATRIEGSGREGREGASAPPNSTRSKLWGTALSVRPSLKSPAPYPGSRTFVGGA